MAKTLNLTDTELLEVRKFAVLQAVAMAGQVDASASNIVGRAQIIETYLIRAQEDAE